MKVCRLCRRYAAGGAAQCVFDGGVLLEGPVPPVAPGDVVGGYAVTRALAAGQTGVLLLGRPAAPAPGEEEASAAASEAAEGGGEAGESGGEGGEGGEGGGEADGAAGPAATAATAAAPEVVVKVLNPGPEGGVDARRAVLETAASLSLDGLQPIEAVLEHEGRLCVVGRIMAGETLAALVPRVGPLSPEDAVALGRRLCEVLTVVHEAGLAHLDVRPGHVLVPEGRGPAEAVLFDLGSPSPPGSNAAPERFGGGTGGPKTDVYGVCTTLYVALAGRSAFRADAPEELSWLVHNAPPPPLRVLRAVGSVDPALERLLIAGMAKRPEARPDLATLAEGLDAIAAGDADRVERVLAQVAAVEAAAAEAAARPSAAASSSPPGGKRRRTGRSSRPLLLEEENPTMRFVRKILPLSMLGPTGLTQGFFIEGDRMEREVARAEWEEAQARRENAAAWLRLVTLLVIAVALGGITVWALTH